MVQNLHQNTNADDSLNEFSRCALKPVEIKKQIENEVKEFKKYRLFFPNQKKQLINMSLKPKQVDFLETWSTLKETVKGVITLGNVPRTVWYDRFVDIYNLCVAFPESLADRLYEETKQFLTNHVTELYKQVRSEKNKLLTNYYTAWVEYSQGLDYLHQLYLYLNRQHIKKQKISESGIIYRSPEVISLDVSIPENLEIGELGLYIWQKEMLHPLREILISKLIESVMVYLIDREHPTLETPPEVTRACLLSFVSLDQNRSQNLQLYSDIFEKPFLDKCSEYFENEANQLLSTNNVSDYMEKVRQKQLEYFHWSQKYLHRMSIAKVQQHVEKHYVGDHIDIIHNECKDIIRNNRTNDLINSYLLLKPVSNGLNVLINEFIEYVKEQGLNIVKTSKDDHLIDNLLKEYHKYDKMITEVFSNDNVFVCALDKSFVYIVNFRKPSQTMCRSPELLAKYCDILLKKSNKSTNDSDIEYKLTESMIIFKYIDDKDIFQKFYSRMLAKRLIHQQSYNMDAEELMINRLKHICGYDFAKKLHRMYTDIFLSSDLNNKFTDYLCENSYSLNIHFQIYVLQEGAWPLRQQAQNNFSAIQELEKIVQYFEAFYFKNFSGRKLTWLHHLCQAEIKLNYLSKTYILTLQTYQMAILLLFEKVDQLTVDEIQNTLQINNEQLQKYAMTLVEYKLLCSNTNNFSPETILSLNFNFSSKRTKFRLTSVVQKENSQQDLERTISSVEEDRKLYLEAAIVRIMKSRKVLLHNHLIQEVLSLSGVSFTPSVHLIKKCIESLIDKQYLERTPNTTDSYSYVA